MFLALVKISPVAGKSQEIVDILLSVRGPTMADPGCLECGIYEELDEDHAIMYMEKWRSMAEMNRHIRSSRYTRLLSALDLSSREPEVRFYGISETHGMELIESLRSQLPGGGQ